MARSQQQLQALLEELVGPDVKVYFQPPSDIRMQYPCLVYSRDRDEVQYADNVKYGRMLRYEVIVIDEDPESPILEKINPLRHCSLQRTYAVEGLNHDVYDLFF